MDAEAVVSEECFECESDVSSGQIEGLGEFVFGAEDEVVGVFWEVLEDVPEQGGELSLFLSVVVSGCWLCFPLRFEDSDLEGVGVFGESDVLPCGAAGLAHGFDIEVLGEDSVESVLDIEIEVVEVLVEGVEVVLQEDTLGASGEVESGDLFGLHIGMRGQG